MAYSDTIGEMTERVDLQAPPNPEASQNAFGEPSGAWATMAPQVWAKVESAGAIEPLEGDKLKPIGMYTVTLRKRTDINETWRIAWNELFLYVKAIQPLGPIRSRFMVLTCSTAKVD